MASEICQHFELPAPVCADPGDDKFIACAMASRTKVIVSGDNHLLDIKNYKGIEILNPRQFAQKLLKLK